ncbi:metalloprotease family protein [Halobacillus sp. A5]|uniref:metalloprotease family protein n=1 Tax=Halobacillus sp. A5 TaxID=2880263 RepID=UPI0020A6B53F|nr:metalloprotease family protein [Halobacillus sp. A5]MCP3027075.1 metalloprotease family protein [Halobacillus sp. A5]
MDNFVMMMQVLFTLYLLLFAVLLLHELIHLLFIKIYKKEVQSFTINFWGGKAAYVNDHNYVDILVISAAPNLVLPMLGCVVFSLDSGLYFNAFAFFCLINLVNLLPFTSDGSAVLYSIMKLAERKKA